MDCSPPGSSIHRIFQARILEWVAMPFSRGSSQPRDRTWVSPTAGGILYHLSHHRSPFLTIEHHKSATNLKEGGSVHPLHIPLPPAWRPASWGDAEVDNHTKGRACWDGGVESSDWSHTWIQNWPETPCPGRRLSPHVLLHLGWPYASVSEISSSQLLWKTPYPSPGQPHTRTGVSNWGPRVELHPILRGAL